MLIEDLIADFTLGKRAPPDGITSDAAAIVLTQSACHLVTVSALHVARSKSLFLEIDPSHRAVLKAILELPDLSDERPPGCRSTSTTSSEDAEEEDEEQEDEEQEDEEKEDDEQCGGGYDGDDERVGELLEDLRDDVANLTHTFYTAFAISQVVAVASMLAVTVAIFGVWRDLRCV